MTHPTVYERPLGNLGVGAAVLLSEIHSAADTIPPSAHDGDDQTPWPIGADCRAMANRRGLPRWEGASVIPTSGQPFVRLVAVSKSYGTGTSKLEVLDQVELTLPQGQTTSLVGRSGSGKSTLLSVIAGLMRPDSGQVYIGGQQMDQMDDDARARPRAERVGFVLQSDRGSSWRTEGQIRRAQHEAGPGRRICPSVRQLDPISDCGRERR